tara:strand:- start:628 stop:2412 length:1785 start_codon:yes stop_codon:yes gene_type:complete
MKANADVLVEISWEVCNKVGGIYTVVTSKINPILNYYKKESYYCVGPYFPKKAFGVFEEKVPTADLKKVFDKLKEKGIECHYGTWLTDGNPNTILIDFSNFENEINNIKKELWEWYQIDSLNASHTDFGEPNVWARSVGLFLEEFEIQNKKKIVAHCHEWLAGGALLYLKQIQSKVATVFTTHATMLGRTLASSNVNLYAKLKEIDPKAAAYEHGMQEKFLMEKACAEHADAFTTVSEITGIEAEHLLGKKPDIILPNGLDIGKFPSFEEVSIRHKLFKNKMYEFILYYFFPYYSFDIDNTLIFFLAGRYEFHDKGIDLFIDALAELNKQLKKEKSDKTVVAFFFVPGNIKGIKPDLLESKTKFSDINDEINDEIDDIKNHMIHCLLSKKKFSQKNLMSESTSTDMKKKILALSKKGSPPLSTHDLYDEDKDQILNACWNKQLLNKKDDKVKVIYYPIYLTGADSLLNTSYYESMVGSHLGVFPSYYEPWGYTPLEAAALGVGSVTTDLAGFGRYICKDCNQQKQPGVWVLNRYNKDDAQVTKDLTKTLLNFTNLTTQQRVENKITARKIAQMCDWKYFVKHYIEAHNLALKNV